jgi:hypothetical protein
MIWFGTYVSVLNRGGPDTGQWLLIYLSLDLRPTLFLQRIAI